MTIGIEDMNNIQGHRKQTLALQKKNQTHPSRITTN